MGLLRDAWVNGKVMLLDEVDASNPEILVAMQGIAALKPGDTFTFPDGQNLPGHDNFRLVATGNTWGDGGDAIYSARQQLDGAFLTRFSMLDFDYDECLEQTIALNAIAA
jgi:midasin (ATPase involved in ribosome maturation)